MITRMELTNVMSHAHTVIEPAAGLTVLVELCRHGGVRTRNEGAE